MKTFIADIIPRIKRYSQKLDNLTLLTNQHWVVVDELRNTKFVYIFRDNNELLIAQNGKVRKGRWEYLGNNPLLVENTEGSYLFRHVFFDANVLALKTDGKDEYAFLVNENKYGGELNSIDKVMMFLENKYLRIFPGNEIGRDCLPEIASTGESRDSNLKVVMGENGKYGFVDEVGNIIISAKYDGAYNFFGRLCQSI